jgi:DNA repair ATPase RecN
MIDEYLLETNNIDKAWVEAFELCKQALQEREGQQAEIDFLQATKDLNQAEFNEIKSELELKKAEIERLEAARKVAAYGFNSMETLYKTKCKELEVVKTNVIQKFAERFKEKASIQRDRVTGIPCYVISNYKLECLVKEMMEAVKNE